MSREVYTYKLISEMFGKDVFDRYLNDYRVRILIQKFIFIYQEMKKKIWGYPFYWYLTGPYSVELDYDIGTVIISIIKPNDSRFKQNISSFDRKIINKIREINIPLELKDYELYELIASAFYLEKHSNIIKKPIDLKQSLINCKSYNEKQIDLALIEYNTLLGRKGND